MNNTTTDFSFRLKELVKAAGNQKDVASELGITRQSLNNYMSGATVPGCDVLLKMADTFGVSTDYLLGRSSVSSVDEDLRTVCRFTGLSENAALSLELLSRTYRLSPAETANGGEESFRPVDELDAMLNDVRFSGVLYQAFLARGEIARLTAESFSEKTENGAPMTSYDKYCRAQELRKKYLHAMERVHEEFDTVLFESLQVRPLKEAIDTDTVAYFRREEP